MGIIRDAKADKLRKDAHEWRMAGHQVFVARINVPGWNASFNGGPSGGIPDLALMVEAVESCGWRLDQMSFAQDKNGKPEGYCLFRAI